MNEAACPGVTHCKACTRGHRGRRETPKAPNRSRPISKPRSTSACRADHTHQAGAAKDEHKGDQGGGGLGNEAAAPWQLRHDSEQTNRRQSQGKASGKAVDDEQRLVDNDRVPPCLVADDIDAPGLQLGEHSVRQPEEPARMAALPAIRAGERRANQGPGVPSVSSIRPWPMWNVGVRALVRFHSLDFIGRCRKG